MRSAHMPALFLSVPQKSFFPNGDQEVAISGTQRAVTNITDDLDAPPSEFCWMATTGGS
jgi:hypothetical protein